jgi:ribose-phosphate pyrophosphokinase
MNNKLTKQFSKMLLFAGSSHPELGQAIAKYIGIKLGDIKLSTFSCGETYAKVNESIRGQEVYIIQTAGSNINDDLMELFIMMDGMKRASAAKINVVIPHFGYARQDKKSEPREPISARLIADLLTAVGVDRVITVDLHADQIQGFFNSPVDHLTALPLFADYFKKKKLKDLVVVAPDAGRVRFAKRLASIIGNNTTLAFMHKSRPRHNVAEVVNIVGEVKDKTVLLVDDMVDTAGSITAGLANLKKHGCKDEIYLATTHPVFSGPAIERLAKAGFNEVIVTDTIPIPKESQFKGLKTLSMAPMIAEAIKRDFLNDSISSLW